jgi:hypothetical protein
MLVTLLIPFEFFCFVFFVVMDSSKVVGNGAFAENNPQVFVE